MKKIGALLLTLAFLLPSGCSSVQTFKNEDDTLKIGFIYETMTVERWQRDRDIFVAEATELGATVIVKNAYEDSIRQEELGMEMVNEGVDVLVLVAYDKDALADLVKYAHNNNVKVIAYDRIIKNADVDLYISFDNTRVGEMMGETATNAVPKGNYIILNGTQRDDNSFHLRQGYFKYLQPLINKGDINIVGETWVDLWRDEGSYNFVREKLGGGTNVDAIIAGNDQLAEGAIRALSEKRLAGNVFVTGQDSELAACQRVVEGMQNMTVYKPINVLAKGAAEYAVKMAKGEDIGPCDSISDGTYNINYVVYDPILVTKDNIMDNVIKDKFYTMEQVYANVPPDEWPTKQTD
jgi:D-xylose transport system substrate-binding protein